ncbi:MAG: hypothetical protein ACK4GT_07720 [Pararhodobacter sp.]
MGRAAVWGLILAQALCLPALADGTARSAFIAEAKLLITDMIAAGCNGAPGRMMSRGVIVRDLDGDHRDDLILSHEGVECEGEVTRSVYCGAQVCSTVIYLQRDEGLERQAEVLGSVIDIDGSLPPVVHVAEHGGSRLVLNWNGAGFASP